MDRSVSEHFYDTIQAIAMLFLDSVTALFAILFIIFLYVISNSIINLFHIDEKMLLWTNISLGPISLILNISALVGFLIYIALASITILSIVKKRQNPESTHSSGGNNENISR